MCNRCYEVPELRQRPGSFHAATDAATLDGHGDSVLQAFNDTTVLRGRRSCDDDPVAFTTQRCCDADGRGDGVLPTTVLQCSTDAATACFYDTTRRRSTAAATCASTARRCCDGCCDAPRPSRRCPSYDRGDAATLDGRADGVLRTAARQCCDGCCDSRRPRLCCVLRRWPCCFHGEAMVRQRPDYSDEGLLRGRRSARSASSMRVMTGL